MLTLTPRVLGTCCCVLLLQLLCKMKKLIGGVKQAFSSGPSSLGSGSCSSDGSRDSAWSSSFVPSPHKIKGGRSAILHTMMILWPRIVMAFPSVAPSRLRSMSLSTSESLCHTPFRDSGNEASIRVPRMFHSHV
jgi:hypothetical protein